MTLRMRPRFTFDVELTRQEVRRRFETQARELPCHVTVLDVQVECRPHRRDAHLWSPYLKLLIHPLDPEDTNRLLEEELHSQDPNSEEHSDPEHQAVRLEGSFGPNPSLWTFFMALYAISIVTGTMALLATFSQWQLNQPLIALWGVAFALILALLVWLASQLGQRFAQEQMSLFYNTIGNVLDLPPSSSSATSSSPTAANTSSPEPA